MPAYNEGENLGTLIPQVLQTLQTLGSHVEIVLVNDRYGVRLTRVVPSSERLKLV